MAGGTFSVFHFLLLKGSHFDNFFMPLPSDSHGQRASGCLVISTIGIANFYTPEPSFSFLGPHCVTGKCTYSILIMGILVLKCYYLANQLKSLLSSIIKEDGTLFMVLMHVNIRDTVLGKAEYDVVL